MHEICQDIIASIQSFQKTIKQYLPTLEAEALQLIKEKSNDNKKIETLLDTILSLTELGIGDDLYIKLLEHYKTIDAKGAAFYWNMYDKENEDGE